MHWSEETKNIAELFPREGVFLTGIESSDPWVEGKRRNQLKEAHNFYEHWQKRLENIHDLGIRWLRFGPPYSQTHIGKDAYDFSLVEKVLKKCEELEIEVMIDLLHFGLPEWLHANSPEQVFFQNNGFPIEFATYVGHVARTFPNINYFTVVNEPFITANFSTKLGFWNEGQKTAWDEDKFFMNAIKNIARAAILGKEEIERVWKSEKRKGSPIFIQNESFEVAIVGDDAHHRHAEANAFNLRRFSALDLIFGHRDEEMKKYMLSHGFSRIDYEWCMDHGNTKNTVLGVDHYPTCVHRFGAQTTVDETPNEPLKLYDIIKVYWDRYTMPVLHTETNGWPKNAVSICMQTYTALNKLRREGYPILGMGWYGDEYQVGWHYAMFGPLSFQESPVGLFYKGELQPVGKLFSELAKKGLEPIITS
jgi:beta-glucosidase/6-phospho-beta-glucosidase/beta-galactosidase